MYIYIYGPVKGISELRARDLIVILSHDLHQYFLYTSGEGFATFTMAHLSNFGVFHSLNS